ncbi:ATP-binding protein [Lactococcus lactis]|uniref:ATP-binding protein n=1 Tax=Lactococcus lactis TaxID=1358 RepID=UPI0022E4F4E0|nr:ATP-binding protein [Lactococcus lactis]
MIIDYYYSKIDKSNFYLGMISQVNRGNGIVQVENLSLLNHRKIKFETLIPNTINYLVVIDSVQGLFLGEIYQSKVNSSDSVHESMNGGRKDSIFPEISVDIIGLLSDDGKFKLSGFKTVGITDKVYIANEKLTQKYLTSVEINEYFVDKNRKNPQIKLDKLAKIGNFDSEYLSLQPNTLFDRHLMAVGTTNSGKSTSALSILDKLVLSKRKILIIDPTGEYRNSFSSTEVVKLTLGEDTFLSTKDITEMDWVKLFGVEDDANKAFVLTQAIMSLKYQHSIGRNSILIKKGKSASDIKSKLNPFSGMASEFDLSLLEEQIKEEAIKEDKNTHEYKSDGNVYNALLWLLQIVSYYKNQTKLIDFFKYSGEDKKLFDEIDKFSKKRRKRSLYIDASRIGTDEGIGSVIIDLISNYLINTNLINSSPFVLFVDEVHRYTKFISTKENNQTGLTSIAREGRKKGIFLFLTTQNPKDVPEVLLGQVGTMIIHRVTHSEELRAIQNHIHQNTISQVQKLNQGEAILTSINLLQDIHVRFEKCKRKHENSTPIL